MASESKKAKMVHMKANSTMEPLMDKEPIHGQMEGSTRASFLITNPTASEYKYTATEFTKAYSKTTIQMELDSSPTLVARSTMGSGKMDYFTELAQFTLALKRGLNLSRAVMNGQDTRYIIKWKNISELCNIRSNCMAFQS